MPPSRNEPCWCGAGRKYKHCHYAIDSAPEAEKYAVAQRVYAQNWRGTAQHHFDTGVYTWLAERLAQHRPRRILDVGCGSGHGLVALLNVLGQETQIVALDENASCLEIAADTIRKDAGIDPLIVRRMSISFSDDGWQHVAGPLDVPLGHRVVLVESDVCNDDFLRGALQKWGAFDAVTIWLTGVHMLRPFNVAVLDRGISSEGQHRLYVQNAVYELADAVLSPGGILQVGDRGMAPETELLRADIEQGHRAQASVTSLEFQGLEWTPYTEPKSGKTPIMLTLGTSGAPPTSSQLAIVSILSKKQG